MATELIGDFELLEFLASGTVGDVYRARHHASGQQVVIKFLQADVAWEPDVQRRFVREVAIAEKLNHPNVVRHLDCGLYDDRIFFAMEFVECGTLRDVLKRRGQLPWREAVECAIQVCAALDHAHEKGVIHRDLKPSNLFLSEEGSVKVGDFGLARDLNSTRLTLDGQTVGTCRYMPPEQIAGEGELTGTTDLYALGCILYEMLTGGTPFNGRSIVEIFEAHLNEDPTPPRELVRDCPEDLSDLVMQLLAKSPNDRPAKASAVRIALQDILQSRPVRKPAAAAPKMSRTTDGDPFAPPPSDEPNLTERLLTTAPALPQDPSRSIALWAIAAAVLLAVVAALAWILVG